MEIPLKSVQDVEALLLKLIKQGSVEDLDITPAPMTVPTKDIKGFDSLTVLEVLTEFEEQTGLHFEGEIFYIDTSPKQHRSVHEVALAIWKEINQGG